VDSGVFRAGFGISARIKHFPRYQSLFRIRASSNYGTMAMWGLGGWFESQSNDIFFGRRLILGEIGAGADEERSINARICTYTSAFLG
jgi:hypothetical protein